MIYLYIIGMEKNSRCYAMQLSAQGLVSGVLWLPVSGQVQRQVGSVSTPAVLKFLRFPRVELFNLNCAHAHLVAWSHMPYCLPESMVFNALYCIMVHLEKVQAQDSGDDPMNGSP